MAARGFGIVVALLALTPARDLMAGDQERVASLRAHAIPVATLDPASRDLTDLEPLRQLLAAARVVMLGEATRGDGSSMLARTRLIRFLHQEMGFDVLVFECGLYDCGKAWDDIRAGTDAKRTLGAVLPPFYTGAAAFQPLLDWIAARAITDRPLAIAGMDSQMIGGADGNGLAVDLRAALARAGIAADSVPGFAALEASLHDVLLERYATGEAAVPPGRERERVNGTLDELRRRLKAAPGSADTVFWLRVLDNIASYTEASWREGKYAAGSAGAAEAHAVRDRQMAANLVWLARQRFPDRKLIVWSLNVHLARDLDRLATGNAALRERLDALSTIGDGVAKALGDELYTIAFTAFDGRLGMPRREPYLLMAPTRGSFEDLMARTGLPAALVDLRQLPQGGAWLRGSFVARPISNIELLGIWPRHVDALFFLKTVEPASN